MIQFNLLPDVKQAYIRAKRRKRVVAVTSTSVIAGCLTVLVLLFAFVNVAQKQHLKDLSSDINAQVKELQDTPNLDSILTVQNQLMVLGSLHDKCAMPTTPVTPVAGTTGQAWSYLVTTGAGRSEGFGLAANGRLLSVVAVNGTTAVVRANLDRLVVAASKRIG